MNRLSKLCCLIFILLFFQITPILGAETSVSESIEGDITSILNNSAGDYIVSKNTTAVISSPITFRGTLQIEGSLQVLGTAVVTLSPVSEITVLPTGTYDGTGDTVLEGTFINNGIISGYLIINSNGNFNNNGNAIDLDIDLYNNTIINNGVWLGGELTLGNNSTLINNNIMEQYYKNYSNQFGLLIIDETSSLINNPTGVFGICNNLINNGNIENDGIICLEKASNVLYPIIPPSTPQLLNNDNLINNGTIVNNLRCQIINTETGTFNNYGTFINDGIYQNNGTDNEVNNSENNTNVSTFYNLDLEVSPSFGNNNILAINLDNGSYYSGNEAQKLAIGTKIKILNVHGLSFIFKDLTVNNKTINVPITGTNYTQSYTFELTSNTTVIANFSADLINIEVEVVPANGGKIEGLKTTPYEFFEDYTITAIPNSGYQFYKWESSDNEIITYDSTITGKAFNDEVFTAYFEPADIEIYTINADTNTYIGGFVTGSGRYIEGQSYTLTATPFEQAGYEFNYWTLDGEVYSRNPILTGIANENLNLVANFSFAGDLSLSTDKVYLSTLRGEKQSETVVLTTGLDDDLLYFNWYSNNPNVAVVEAEGNIATIIAVNEGVATVTVAVGDHFETISVVVSNNSVVLDDIIITTDSPDYFTVTAVNVQPNPALHSSSSLSVEYVPMFVWSESNQSDINAKVSINDGNNWYYTFPVNDTPINNYFIKADSLIIHIYGSTIFGQNGNMIGTSTYDWLNDANAGTNEIGYITYAQNLGFEKPSVYNGDIAGTTGKNIPLEGIRISSNIEGVQILSDVLVQDKGWLTSIDDGTYAGTMFENKQLYGLRLNLSGSNSENYTIRYRVHVQDLGWLDWVSNGETACAPNSSKQLEAIQVELIKTK